MLTYFTSIKFHYENMYIIEIQDPYFQFIFKSELIKFIFTKEVQNFIKYNISYAITDTTI